LKGLGTPVSGVALSHSCECQLQRRCAEKELEMTSGHGCYDATSIFLEYEIMAMGRHSMNIDVAVMR
jgi:hypothetical protein